MKSNDRKKHLFNMVLQVLGELLLTASFFIAGNFILKGLNIDLFIREVDQEIAIMIGIIAFLIVLTVICCIVQLIKRSVKKQ